MRDIEDMLYLQTDSVGDKLMALKQMEHTDVPPMCDHVRRLRACCRLHVVESVGCDVGSIRDAER